MTFSRTKMNQDELEEEILFQGLWGQVQVVIGMLQSSVAQSHVPLNTATLLTAVCLVLLTILWLVKYHKVLGWFSQIFSLEGAGAPADAREWSRSGWSSCVFCLQGRRENNEDRAAIETVSMVEGANTGGEVDIWAVMDGHGGQFCADYSIKHFIPSLKISVQKLKLLTCSLNSSEKLALYEKHFDIAPKYVLKYLQISDFNTSKPQTPSDLKRDSSKDESDTNERSAEKSDIPDVAEVTKTPSLMSRCQIVMSSRNKSLEELPSKSKKHQSEEEKDTVEFRSRTPPKYKPRSKSKVFSSEKKKLNKSKSSSESETDITDFIKDGEILYSKLIKYEISKFDSFLLEAAKKTNNIGGSTLILALHDSGSVWVANVGDSRGVFSTDTGLAVPMSYDHKPCQLKEKKRIQEAGGFVAMNGVWRVMGVLATSRALGDYPLKDKKVVVCDPDILTFSIKEHRMQFGVLASDGLWDTHTNEDAVSVLASRVNKDSKLGSEVLAREAYDRGSLDNITVLVIDFQKIAAKLKR